MSDEGPEVERLIREARRLRGQWNTGVYVSLAKGVKVANDLADELERRRPRQAA